MKSIIEQVVKEAYLIQNKSLATRYASFFKTAPGQYGEGDKFLGINVGNSRKIAKKYAPQLEVGDLTKLFDNPFHEIRLIAALIFVEMYSSTQNIESKNYIYDVYLANLEKFNNWDLIDLTADKILGKHLYENDGIDKLKVLTRLTQSKVIWNRRAAIIATFYFLKNDSPQLTIHIADKLLDDKHDLIHKAVGWMLREMGKRCDKSLLLHYLDKNYRKMSRTTLRYSLERLDPLLRNYYLKL